MEQWELIEVEWVDSAGTENGWHKPGKKEMEIHGCVTVGQLYAQSVDRIVIVLSRDSPHRTSMVSSPSRPWQSRPARKLKRITKLPPGAREDMRT